jgi:DNA repair protein RadD
MVGRGLRLHDGKDYCRILDFGGNIRRHGCIDAINPPKGGTKNFELVWECKRCEEINATGEDVCKRCELPKDATKCSNSECGGWLLKGQDACPDCGALRPQQEPEARHETQAEDSPILSEEVKAVWVPVTETYYAVHAKRGADEWAPKTLRVSYFDGLAPIADEWICVEHIGFARIKAERWWNARSNSFCPTLASQAVELAKLGAIATTTAIKIVQKPGSKFPEIVGHQTCSKPPKVSQEDWVKNYDADEEPPF